MAIVKQLDKRSGITYAYESKSFWDKEKKQSRCTRTLIGRVDPSTGEILPTDQRNRRQPLPADTGHRKGPAPSVRTRRLFCGATFLFDQIGRKTGVTADLKTCFPSDYRKILSIAYYLILEDRNPLSRFGKWSALHRHPFGGDIPSQRSSELFASITEEGKDLFFRLQGKRRTGEEFWAYDSTSISSWSQQLGQVRYGKNKDHDRLAQLNLLLVYGQESNLPFYYRKLAGNIPDVKTVKGLVRDLGVLGYAKVKLVMDRGFYSKGNIDELYANHFRFLIAVSARLSVVKDAIRAHGKAMRTFDHYDEAHEVYCHTDLIGWECTRERPYKGGSVTDDRRMYLHLYYSPEQAVEDEKAFTLRMLSLKAELESDRRVPEHEEAYRKYFTVTSTPVRGLRVEPRTDAMAEAKECYGFFAFLSNDIRDPLVALRTYRNRDVIEKAFGNVKDRLNCRRTLVSSEASLEGKLFVEFVALIYLSYIKKMMQDKGLFTKYTLQGLLDQLDVIEEFESPGKAPYIGEILERQRQIYLDMEVDPPIGNSSL